MNIANKITVVRIVLVVGMIALLLCAPDNALAGYGWAKVVGGVVFAIAAFTDYLDGHIARSRNLVTTFGKFMATFFKILLGLLLFPIAFVIFAMLLALVVITIGIGEIFVVDIGNFEGLIEATNEVGMPLMIFSLLTILVPAIYIAYLFIVLLINKRPRWWVLLVTIIVWFFLLLGTIFSGIAYAESESFKVLSSDSEVERIMKHDGKSNLSRKIMEELNEELSDEDRAEIQRLLNDTNAESIDK